MSVDRYVYVGPFLKCKPRATKRVVTRRICPDCGIALNGGWRFCAAHGKGEDRTEEKDSDLYDLIRDLLISDFSESLTPLEVCGDRVIEGMICLAPNKQNDYGMHVDQECPDEYVTEFAEDEQLAGKAWMSTEFGKEILAIAELCESVEVCWGIVFTAN